MWLSDTSVKRPVFACVINLLIIAFGIVSFTKLPLREYPDTDPPIITIETVYQGAAANVIESRITQIIEDRIAGLEGVKSISSQSENGVSKIEIEFKITRNIDDAANDVRDRVSRVVSQLPDEADPPEISKRDADEQVIMWLNLTGQGMDIMALTDYARRNLQDRFSALDGISRVRIGGAQEKSMRIWLDRKKLAARNLTVADVEIALRRENIELPAGSVESITRDFTIRMKRSYNTPEDFAQLVLKRGEEGYLVRLADVAKVEIAPAESRNSLRGNQVPMVGLGIVKQSKANTLAVAQLAKAEMQKVNEALPDHMEIKQSFDSSVFIESSIDEVYKTLFIAILLVILVIYAFLGNVRAMLVPAVTVPISLVGTFIILFAFGLSLNLLTLLALVLAIGLVVDDTIVVIENIHRRIELGEHPLVAAFNGTRQVGFAVITTTLVLIFVFIPIIFLEGNVGRLFSEFAIAISSAVIFSSIVALSLSPMLASKLLESKGHSNQFTQWLDDKFEQLRQGYIVLLRFLLNRSILSIGIILLSSVTAYTLFKNVPSEFAPREDRGVFFIVIRGPEGASYDYVMKHVSELEKRMMPFVDTGEIQRLLMRAPASFGTTETFSDARSIVVLSHWRTGRKPIWFYLQKVRELTKDMTGVKIFSIVRQGLQGRTQKPVQFVLGGSTYEELAKWRDIVLSHAEKNDNLQGLDHDYRETKPQIEVSVLQDRAAELGISIETINEALESMLGSRRLTTFLERGEEYDVIVESKKELKQNPLDMKNLYVRSERTQQLIPLSNLVKLEEFADAAVLNRYNRMRSVTIESNLSSTYSLSEALTYLENIVSEHLPEGVTINYKGESLEYKLTNVSVYITFALAIIVIFLILAGLFESFVHPLIIMLTVPLAMTGALAGLWFSGQTLNIYSQIGLIILVGLSAKNGILIVEFVNQLRDEGFEFEQAIIEASSKRLRPIVMTGITTAMGAIPLILSFGAGAETRLVIGTVILYGVLVSTVFTLLIIPVMYQLLARHVKPPEATTRQLESLLKDNEKQV